MDVKIEKGWKAELQEEFGKAYFKMLTDAVRQEYSNAALRIYPPASKIFSAFDLVPFDEVKVVIIGQDPYHGPGRPTGLHFLSIPASTFLPRYAISSKR